MQHEVWLVLVEVEMQVEVEVYELGIPVWKVT